MKILKSFLGFKTEIKELMGSKVIFATDSNGTVWHKFANANCEKSNYIMIDNERIVSHVEDPTTLSPYDGSDVYEVDIFDLNIGDRVVLTMEEIAKYMPTDFEIEEALFKEGVKFYNTELEFASKAVAELKCDIISQEDFEDVKLYMQSIDPYAQNYKRAVKNKRPSIFDRYN